jgi:RNA polymerase sigma-70 factor, ECF subfamily
VARPAPVLGGVFYHGPGIASAGFKVGAGPEEEAGLVEARLSKSWIRGMRGALSEEQTEPIEISEGTEQTEVDPYARWTELVAKVHANEPDGMEELYRIFSRGVRYYLHRQLGPQEIDDKVHDTFLIVVQAIQRGELREPQRLMGFVRTVVRRRVAAHIEQAVQGRRETVELEDGARVPNLSGSPEESALREQRAEIMVEILREISPRDREILTRFYIQEEPQEEICVAMGLSETQFRLLKSRAKARFGEIGRRRLAARPLSRMARIMTQ